MKPTEPIHSPEDVRKAQHVRMLEQAHALAHRATEALKDAPGQAPGAIQYIKLTIEPGSVTEDIRAEAEDKVGEAGWLDVRMAEAIHDESLLLVTVTVPEPKPVEQT